MSKAPSKPAHQTKLVRDLAKILNDTDLTEIEYKTDALKIRVKKGGDTIAYTAPAAPAAPTPSRVPGLEPGPRTESLASTPDLSSALASPMVGTVYLRPSPDADAFVEVGTKVKTGDTLMLVEAMKTFNPITADKDGTVTAIHVEDGQGIEFGEPLMSIS
jgi:acetyl-CoA carboxylase biotin carboxyl carrier protein